MLKVAQFPVVKLYYSIFGSASLGLCVPSTPAIPPNTYIEPDNTTAANDALDELIGAAFSHYTSSEV